MSFSYRENFRESKTPPSPLQQMDSYKFGTTPAKTSQEWPVWSLSQHNSIIEIYFDCGKCTFKPTTVRIVMLLWFLKEAEC